MARLLVEYANQHKDGIILELNDKDQYGKYPVLVACYNNNDEII